MSSTCNAMAPVIIFAVHRTGMFVRQDVTDERVLALSPFYPVRTFISDMGRGVLR